MPSATDFRDTMALPSFPARYRLAPLYRMMISGPARLSAGAVHDTSLARRASNHLPVTAKLLLE